MTFSPATIVSDSQPLRPTKAKLPDVEYFSDLLDKGFIHVSNSPASAPVLFAHKPGGGL
ncbi:hypothetical protein ACO22_07668 [Paracoccidioides brasiliensis]|uniref:Uncharacterized protein n=1 Tax=Paracoccidioides brasiliensis TaxID=121759 RepID=A0A1D2J411_PARBR|nr:hypothetical protein ACO22_07668 [Paracoccidioides brasiliensis]